MHAAWKYIAEYSIPIWNQLPIPRALIIDETSFSDLLKENKLYLFGNGSEKAKDVLKHPKITFIDNIKASAGGMVKFAFEKFGANDFEDTAYFEPFYLKDFVATTSKKDILGIG
jgi:tRNA threonylcarbamoyladenosine biosynthesis protein TsaB